MDIRLSSDLAATESYREAYQSIAEEMRNLVARNNLAEDEANRLSQFNAELLGHANPTQKILYVDRIRRELAETKQVRISVHLNGVPYPTTDSPSETYARNPRP